jgi:hypothetical protein
MTDLAHPDVQRALAYPSVAGRAPTYGPIAPDPEMRRGDTRAIVAVSWVISRVAYAIVLGYGAIYAATYQDAATSVPLAPAAPYEAIVLAGCAALMLAIGLVAWVRR